MPNIRKIPLDIDLAERGKFYCVSERTARRWHNAGADLDDPCSVALHLAGQKTPSPAAVAAVRKILSAELHTLT